MTVNVLTVKLSSRHKQYIDIQVLTVFIWCNAFINNRRCHVVNRCPKKECAECIDIFKSFRDIYCRTSNVQSQTSRFSVRTAIKIINQSLYWQNKTFFFTKMRLIFSTRRNFNQICVILTKGVVFYRYSGFMKHSHR